MYIIHIDPCFEDKSSSLTLKYRPVHFSESSFIWKPYVKVIADIFTEAGHPRFLYKSVQKSFKRKKSGLHQKFPHQTDFTNNGSPSSLEC